MLRYPLRPWESWATILAMRSTRALGLYALPDLMTRRATPEGPRRIESSTALHCAEIRAKFALPPASEASHEGVWKGALSHRDGMPSMRQSRRPCTGRSRHLAARLRCG